MCRPSRGGGRNLLIGSQELSVSGLDAEPDTNSRQEYRTITIGQTFVGLPHNTEVTISFDIETVNGIDSLQVYNTNRLGPNTFYNVRLEDIPKGKSRQSVTVNIRERDNPALENNTIEFYSIYGTNQFYKVSNVMITLGNEPYPYYPAPEDLE